MNTHASFFTYHLFFKLKITHIVLNRYYTFIATLLIGKKGTMNL